jgi:hypothetical protein
VVRRGREIRPLPVAAEAWATGAIAAAQVDVLAGLRSEATEEALARDEEMLVDQARTLPYQSFVRVAAYWEQLADPDRVEKDEELRRAARDVYLERSFGGMWLGQLTLDPMSGAIVGGELERLEQAMFATDWAEAKAATGREPTLADLARTPGQRRADALVEMATRSKMVPRAVFAPSRRVEVSERARLFIGATRRALGLRDRECAHPYCDVEGSKCEADHIIPFQDGVPTTQENGRMVCGFHNRQRNGRPPPGD